MKQPQGPRFTSVGRSLLLAPWDTNPNDSYEWRIVDSPAGSSVSLSAEPIPEFDPDVPGLYTFEADGDRTFRHRVRVFPDERVDATLEAPTADLPASPGDIDSVSVVGQFNGYRAGEDRAEQAGEYYRYETALDPGEHSFGFVVNDEWGDHIYGLIDDDDEDPHENVHWGEVSVDGPGRPHISLKWESGDAVLTMTADVTPGYDSDLSAPDVDVEFYLDDRADVPDSVLTADGATATLDLDAVTDSVRLVAVAAGERHSIPTRVEVSPAGDVDQVGTPPEWAADATIYEMYVRQFAGEVDYGQVSSDFVEFERRVPYIADLGVDTVWLTPICQTPTESGYHITDYFRIADDLGTMAEFDSFVETCHDHGIRVVFDLVINHCSWAHPAFQMGQAGVAEYRDWFIWEDDGSAEHFFNWEHIPNFNYQSPGLRDHLLDVIDFWADRVDGFRADVAWGIPHGFWKEVRERVLDEHPDTLFLDETLPHDPLFHDAEFDMHYDTTLYETLREIGEGDAPASAIFDAVEAPERLGFPDDALHMRYVENHDEARYLEAFGREAQQAAGASTFTLPGTPMIYAGQERGVSEYRGPMLWHGGDTTLTDYYRELTALRADTPALRDGALKHVPFETSGAENAIVAFQRSSPEQTVLVALNFAEDAAHVTLDVDVTNAELVYADLDDAGLENDASVSVAVGSVTVVETSS